MSIKKYREQIIEDMKLLDFYEPSFDASIEQLAKLLEHQRLTEAQWVKLGRPQLTEDGGRAHPLVKTLEGMRRDIMRFYSEFGLTTAGRKKIAEKRRQEADMISSDLAEIFGQIGHDERRPN